MDCTDYPQQDCEFKRYLEDHIAEIEVLVIKLLVDHMRVMQPGKLNPTYELIREWLGPDDWHINLSEDDRKIVGTHEGWFMPEWGPGPWNPKDKRRKRA
jgi:hypothetical protein